MRKLVLVMLSAAACGSDPYMVPPDARILADAPGTDAPEPDAPDAPTIHIIGDAPPLLVKVKDGNGPWLDPTPVGAAFEAAVHGVYSVMFVCADAFGGIQVNQVFQTPDDDRTVQFFCINDLPPGRQVTGHMVQPGSVQLAGDSDRSTATPDWDFTMSTVPDGVADLIATTTDAIAVRRGVAITADTAITPAIDVDLEGTAYVDQAFTVANPRPSELFTASVGFLNASNPDFPARIYLGAADTAKVVPDSGLLPTDTQSVSVRANSVAGGGAKRLTRALRRPFRVGGDASFTLPEAPKNLGWTATAGGFGARWEALSGLDRNELTVSGLFGGGQDLQASGRYLATTGATAVAIDTTVPGFLPAWRFDFTQPYNRLVSLQSGTELQTVTSVSATEDINFDQQLAGRARTPALRRHAEL